MVVVKGPKIAPMTLAAWVRSMAFRAPQFMCGLGCCALAARAFYHHPKLQQEAAESSDRITRRAYVALPDGRMALVHPAVHARLTAPNLFWAVVDTLNPLP